MLRRSSWVRLVGFPTGKWLTSDSRILPEPRGVQDMVAGGATGL